MVIAVLALGIGVNTAVFSIIDRVLLHPFPFREVDRLVELNGITASGRTTGNAPAELEFFATHVRALDQIAFWRWQNLVLTGVDDTDYIYALEVSSKLFDTLGVRPAIGRTFLASDFDSSAPAAAVIGDRLWRQHFRADPALIGRQILLDGKGYTVVGIMGPEFAFANPTHQVWIPYQTAFGTGELRHHLTAIARLRPGISLEQAQRQIDAVMPALPANPDREKGWRAEIRPFLDRFTAEYRRTLLILWSAVGLVLLIACANAASLLLARTSARAREFAVRAALGAGVVRLMKQVFSETMALALAAGIAGVGLAFVLLRLLVAIFPDHLPLPRLDRASINPLALAVTCALVVVTAALCALPACIRLWRSDLTETLTDASRSVSTGRGANRTRAAMIAFEVALSVVLLAGAGLMLQTLERLLRVRLGFEPQHVLTVRVAVPPRVSPAEQANHYESILTEIRSIPAVQQAAITTILPFGNLQATLNLRVNDQVRPTAIYLREISPGYFSTLGVRILKGRDFDARDTRKSLPVVIVSEELARHYWPGEDPIGKQIARKDHPQSGDWSTVVGVVESIKHRSLRTGADAELYFPYTQQMMGAKYTNVVIRAKSDPLSIASAVRLRIHELDPQQPVTEIKTMQALVVDSALETRFHTLLLEIFAALALGLAVTGIFAVVSYSVTQRAREIGIRSALGASRRDVARYVVMIALRPVIVGACAGIACALAATRLLESELFETAPADPVILASVTVILIATAIAAASMPAWRATRIDPVEILRAE